jgi:PD-(D/E)XK nuclease superfamily
MATINWRTQKIKIEMTQLNLFDKPTTVVDKPKEKQKVDVKVKPKIGWSFSKMEMLSSCPRKYYYYYFGGSKRRSKEENREDITTSKNISNIHIIVGDIVHESIAVFLRKRQKENEWNFDRLIWLAKKKLNDIVDCTIDLRNGQQKEGDYATKICKEIYDDFSRKNEIIEFANAKIEQSLGHFYKSEHFEFIRNSAFYTDAIVEHPSKFNLGNIYIDGKIDVAFYHDSKFHIVDWKTSYSEYEETSAQLLVYALWAIDKHNKEIEEICIHKAYLLDGQIETLEFSQRHTERAKVKIRQSIDEMNTLEKYGMEGIKAAFDCCDEPEICKLCSFEKVCKS